MTWPGYPKTYDCWVPLNTIKAIVEKRSLTSRNAIKKENFPTRKDPKNLQIDDMILDISRNIEAKVATNDPFRRCKIKLCTN